MIENALVEIFFERFIDVQIDAARLSSELGVPVVEPTQAAVAMAIGRVRLSW